MGPSALNPPVVRAARNAKKLDEREYLASWKEIAEYMHCGVRTAQRYEREFALPVRRPTARSRGSVMATRAEIDAWLAAAPIRETFRLSRVEQSSRIRNNASQLKQGLIAMANLREQMKALRYETRSALKVLIDRISTFRLHLPSARQDGYGPLINMDLDTGMDTDAPLGTTGSNGPTNSNLAAGGHPESGMRQSNRTPLLSPQNPHKPALAAQPLPWGSSSKSDAFPEKRAGKTSILPHP